MKKLLLVGAALALCLSYATAQNITRSLQGSQDPRGPVGLDTSNSAYFPGHINAFGNFTKAPSLNSGGGGCANSTITAGSTDAAGSVIVVGQGSTAASSCSIVFGSPFNAAPNCVISETVTATGAGSNSQSAVVATTTSFSATVIPSGSTLTWICIGNQ